MAIWANLSVDIVSSMNLYYSDTVHTIMIRDFPVNEFLRIFVRTEFLKGMCTGVKTEPDFRWDCYDNLLITKDRVERLLLMLAAYLSR